MSAEIIKRKQFLFVDDDAAFLTSLQELFSEMSGCRWDIFTAANHAQALAVLSRVRVDVVVLDIGMPVMDGLQFLQLLARTHPNQQLVMLTALATEENRKTSLAGGAALFLQKPVSPGGFADVLPPWTPWPPLNPKAGSVA